MSIEDIRKIWHTKTKGGISIQESLLYDALVLKLGDSLDEELREFFNDNRKNRHATLYVALEAIEKGHSTPAEKELVQNTTVAPSVNIYGDSRTESPELKNSFEEIWVKWPVNHEYPDRKAKAWDSFRSAVKEYGVDKILKVAQVYILEMSDPSLGIVHAKKMSKAFIDEDWIEMYLEKARYDDGGVAKTYFDVFWDIYPPFSGKTRQDVLRDSFTFFRRFFNEEDMCDMYSAVRYMRDKWNPSKDSSGQFNLGFIKFMGQWREYNTMTQKGDLIFEAANTVFIEKWGEDQLYNNYEGCVEEPHMFGNGNSYNTLHSVITSYCNGSLLEAQGIRPTLEVINRIVEKVYMLRRKRSEFLSLSGDENVDYGLVSKIYSLCKQKVLCKPVKGWDFSKGEPLDFCIEKGLMYGHENFDKENK